MAFLGSDDRLTPTTASFAPSSEAGSDSKGLFTTDGCAPQRFVFFLFPFHFPTKMAFPSCSNPLSLQSPFAGRARLHTTQSLHVRIACSHSSRPSSPRLSHRKTVGPCSLPHSACIGEEGRRCDRRLSLQLHCREQGL